MQIEYGKKYIFMAVICFTSIIYAQNTMSLEVGQAEHIINKELYGALMEHWGRGIYTGVYVGESSSIPNTNGIRNDVIEAFKEAGVTCLDWPGGCFAERYDWREGIGPKNARPGGDMRNGFGTAEYFQLCDLIGSVPYITANITSLSSAGMAAWLNLIDSLYPGKIRYWKMGNEIWGGCGIKNSVSAYLDNFDKYYEAIPSSFSGKLFRIADGGSGNGLASSWLDEVMRREMGRVEGVTYHYYAGLNNSGPSFNFSPSEYYSRLRLAWAMDSCMNTCETIMNKYDPEYTVGLMVDEWGAWYSGIGGMGRCYQQNTCRDAVIASMHLNIFNNRCRRVKMALVAQPVNVIQSLLLTGNPPTTDMIKTPTFYVFKMYKVHQEAKMVPVTLSRNEHERLPLINASASVDSAGILHISMCNTHISDEQSVDIVLNGAPEYSSCTATVINGPKYDSYNDYNGREPVNIKPLSDDKVAFNTSSLEVSVPAHSVVTLALTPREPTGVNRLKQHNHEVWSVTPVSGGAVRLRTSGSVAVPVKLTLLGIDGRTVIASDVMTLSPRRSGTIWKPARKDYCNGIYILRMSSGERITMYRVALTR